MDDINLKKKAPQVSAEAVDAVDGKVSSFGPNLVAIEAKRNQWIYIDQSGEKKAGPFGYAYPFNEGVGLVELADESYVFIDASGEIVKQADETFYYASSFSNGLAVIKDNEGAHFIDHDGKKVLGPYTRAFPFQGPFARVMTADGVGIINRDGKMLLNQSPSALYVSEDGVAAIKLSIGAPWYFIDNNGKSAIPGQYKETLGYANGYAAVYVEVPSKKKKKKSSDTGPQMGWAFVDREGTIIPKKQRFHKVKLFGRGGLAPVSVDGKWGLMNGDGKLKVKPKYDMIGDYKEGMAVYYAKGKWGYLNASGKVEIEAKYDNALGFTNGLALVTIGDDDAYINYEGKVVWPSELVE